VQAQILDLLRDLQAETGMAIILITHDLGVIAEMADDVAVMYLGRVVEYAPVEEVFATPRHPYTRALLSAIPIPDPDYRKERIILRGDVPSPISPPSGCYFHPRCPSVKDNCKVDRPEYRSLGSETHGAACHYST
jgi:oligopeptide/dipeptide ABC transporter ATP-binding protein